MIEYEGDYFAGSDVYMRVINLVWEMTRRILWKWIEEWTDQLE